MIISLQEKQWTNINATTGIPVGTKLQISNQGFNRCRIYIGDAAPSEFSVGELLSTYDEAYAIVQVEPDEIVWATSTLSGTMVGVQEGA